MIEFIEKKPGHMFVRCSSEFEHLDAIVDKTQEFLGALIMNDDEFVYKIVLLISEACTNAIEHGNELDPEKTMTMDVEVNALKIEVSVQDEGKGFDFSTVENPLNADNILETSGRGLFFIEEMADECHYEDEGRRVRFLFTRGG